MTCWQAMQGEVAVRYTARDGVATVTICGELDMAAVPVLSEYLAQVLRRGPRLMVFDLSGVSFMDCAAAKTLIRAGRTLPGRPSPLLCHPRPIVRRLLSLTGLDELCSVAP